MSLHNPEHIVTGKSSGNPTICGPTRYALLCVSTKEIFDSIKIVAGLKDSHGTTILADPEFSLNRWKNHFQSLFNDHATTPPRRKTICDPPQLLCPALDVNLPTFRELKEALRFKKPGKAQQCASGILFQRSHRTENPANACYT